MHFKSHANIPVFVPHMAVPIFAFSATRKVFQERRTN